MDECTTTGQVFYLAIIFLVLFALHAVPFFYLFGRWGQRRILGFLPALFSALAPLLAFDQASECRIIFNDDLVGLFFFGSISMNIIFLDFYWNNTSLSFGYGSYGSYGLFLFFLSLTGFGAILSFIWISSRLGTHNQ